MTKGIHHGRTDHIRPLVAHSSTFADLSVHDAPHHEHRKTHDQSSAVTWYQARAFAYSAALPCPAVRVALPDALGERLARPLTALSAMPAFDTSAMDGFAVCGLESQRWTIVGRLLADAADQDIDLAPGQAVEIATGAALPQGASAVLPYEDAQREANSVVAVRAMGRALKHDSTSAAGARSTTRGTSCFRFGQS